MSQHARPARAHPARDVSGLTVAVAVNEEQTNSHFDGSTVPVYPGPDDRPVAGESPDSANNTPGVGRAAWLRAFREEIVDFRQAVRDAPHPELRWDVLGIRSLAARVTARLLSEHVAPKKMALAVFVGVVIGCSPFYGFHIVMCLLAALGLRLNKLIVWLGSNTSIPLVAPFFALASIQCGHMILHGQWVALEAQTLEGAGPANLLGYWLLGFPIVGVATGFLLGGITYYVALRHRN
ncbi:MAG: hypothetical protein CL928_03135 [Deltaproteobacteria bacterium]|nr:hypothetical protein [Deltaproteobacteria bacterium]